MGTALPCTVFLIGPELVKKGKSAGEPGHGGERPSLSVSVGMEKKNQPPCFTDFRASCNSKCPGKEKKKIIHLFFASRAVIICSTGGLGAFSVG